MQAVRQSALAAVVASFRMAFRQIFSATFSAPFSSSRVCAGTFGAYCLLVSTQDVANSGHDIPVVFR
ncbi:MAG TPA: hypothetical protein DD420_22240 [Streptomyces sp.]|nr:hypothetical protein [Streptomyces sp.]